MFRITPVHASIPGMCDGGRDAGRRDGRRRGRRDGGSRNSRGTAGTRRAGECADRAGRAGPGRPGGLRAGGVHAGQQAVPPLPDAGAGPDEVRGDREAGQGCAQVARRGRDARDESGPALDRCDRQHDSRTEGVRRRDASPDGPARSSASRRECGAARPDAGTGDAGGGDGRDHSPARDDLSPGRSTDPHRRNTRRSPGLLPLLGRRHRGPQPPARLQHPRADRRLRLRPQPAPHRLRRRRLRPGRLRRHRRGRRRLRLPDDARRREPFCAEPRRRAVRRHPVQGRRHAESVDAHHRRRLPDPRRLGRGGGCSSSDTTRACPPRQGTTSRPGSDPPGRST